MTGESIEKKIERATHVFVRGIECVRTHVFRQEMLERVHSSSISVVALSALFEHCQPPIKRIQNKQHNEL